MEEFLNYILFFIDVFCWFDTSILYGFDYFLYFLHQPGATTIAIVIKWNFIYKPS